MDIDLSVLRSLENEKDISSETAIKAIENALLMAYHKTEGANPVSRVEVNRTTGHVTVWARMDGAAGEGGADGAVGREYDDTPAGFGRIAATTARQVILQRLRDVEDEITFGEYAGHEGDIVAGVIQQGRDPRSARQRRLRRDQGRTDLLRPLVGRRIRTRRHSRQRDLTRTRLHQRSQPRTVRFLGQDHTTRSGW